MRARLVVALCLTGCGLDPHALLTVEDPSGAATAGVSMTIGNDDSSERFAIADRAFPMTATVISDAPGERTVSVAAFDAGGDAIARGQAVVRFPASGSGADVVVLGAPCDVDDDCSDGKLCTGPGRCVGGGCRVDDQPFEPDDDNPCTTDSCDPATGPVFVPRADGDSCSDAVVDGICVGGTCGASTCGDGFVDDGVLGESCDDQNQDPNDGCAFCQRTRWTVTLHAAGRPDPLDTAMLAPNDVAYDSLGNLYVVDTVLSHVLRQDAVSGAVVVVAGDGHSRRPIEAARNALLTIPKSVLVDDDGNLYIADAASVRALDRATEVVVQIAGGGTMAIAPQMSLAALDAAINPTAMAFARNGDLLVASAGTVYRVDLNADPPSIAYEVDVGGIVEGLVVDSAGRLFASTGTVGEVRIFDGATFEEPIVVPDITKQLAMDVTGRLYITSEHRIYSVAPGGRTAVSWIGDGTNRAAPDGPATTISDPSGLALDPNGVLVFGENGGGRVRRFLSGALETVVGRGGFITDGIEPRSLPTIPYDFEASQVDFDSVGRVVLANRGAPGQVWRLRDGLVERLAGSPDPAATTVDGAALDTRLSTPRGLAVDATDRLYVSTSSAIRRVDGDRIETLAQGLDEPTKLALVGDRLEVLEGGEGRVVEVDVDSGAMTVRIGGGSQAPGAGRLADGVAFPSIGGFATFGDVTVISDPTGHRVWGIGADGRLFPIAGNGTTDQCTPGALALATCVPRPTEVALDRDTVFVSFGTTSVTVAAIDRTTGTIERFAGGGTAVHDGALATELQLTSVHSITLNGDDLYLGHGAINIAELLMYPRSIPSPVKLLRRIDRTTRVSRTVAGRAMPRNEGVLERAALGTPRAVVARDERLLVADGVSGTVREIDFEAGTLLSVVATLDGRRVEDGDATLTALLEDASGIVEGPDGALFVSESRRHLIRRIDTTVAPWRITTFAGDGSAGSRSGPTLRDARFNGPSGLAYDSSGGHLYIADTDNHVIRRIRIEPPEDVVELFAGSVGNPNPPGVTVPTADARFERPRGLAFRDGVLYVADTGHASIREVREGVVQTLVSEATDTIVDPVGIAADGFGNVVFSTRTTVQIYERDSNRARRIYGEEPRTTFPESVTRCLEGLTILDTTERANRIFVVDRCRGFLLQLDRAPR